MRENQELMCKFILNIWISMTLLPSGKPIYLPSYEGWGRRGTYGMLGFCRFGGCWSECWNICRFEGKCVGVEIGIFVGEGMPWAPYKYGANFI
jgi:hypothetical protein